MVALTQNQLLAHYAWFYQEDHLLVIFLLFYLGVPCACPSRHCSIYDICRRRCIRTMDRSGANLPILQESDTERQFEAANEVMKYRVDTRRVERSNHTRQLEGSYRNLQKRITLYLCHLVNESELPYSILKRWVYSLRFDLRARIPERNPPVEKMFNEFYSRFYDTERLRELMVKVEEHLMKPLAVKLALQEFEEEVDTYLSSRVFLHGLNGDGQQMALFCVDPEWRLYPAHDLYQIHKRACEALQRVKGQQFTVICFCTVLTEYVLLNVANGFAQKMNDQVERQPVCIDEANSRITPPLSDEVADTPSRSLLLHASESAIVEDQSKFPFSSKISANDHSESELVPGIECVSLDITSSLNVKSGWSSLEYISAESERIPSLISPIQFFFSPRP